MIESVNQALDFIENHNSNIKDIIGHTPDSISQEILDHIWTAEACLSKAANGLHYLSIQGKTEWET